MMARANRKPIDRDELMQRLRGSLTELRERYGVGSLGLFGSYGRDAARKKSDVDLLVEFERTPSLFLFIEVQQYLSDLLGVEVDLVLKSGLKPTIGRRILQEVISM
ncbi:MAG: nucleotidyltransferase family protein [Candidatus Marsarchaeota archaeon]|nr:nucleotidyltransferase family protein [Candidatus Marsarchaeota archaeon]